MIKKEDQERYEAVRRAEMYLANLDFKKILRNCILIATLIVMLFILIIIGIC